MLPKMLETLFARAPEMVDRCDDFSADRGLDNAPQKKQLWDKWTIRPLVDTRLMWKAEKEEPDYDPKKPITRALFPDRADVIVHDERGRVSCICPKTGEVPCDGLPGLRGRPRPLRHAEIPLPGGGLRLRLRRQQRRATGRAGWSLASTAASCASISTSMTGASSLLRHGAARPGGAATTDALRSNGSTAVSTTASTSRTHYIRGLAKMKTRVGLALAVMMALALGQVRAGHAERMRSLVGAAPYLDTG